MMRDNPCASQEAVILTTDAELATIVAPIASITAYGTWFYGFG
jgi:hypothetical protein